MPSLCFLDAAGHCWVHAKSKYFFRQYVPTNGVGGSLRATPATYRRLHVVQNARIATTLPKSAIIGKNPGRFSPGQPFDCILCYQGHINDLVICRPAYHPAYHFDLLHLQRQEESMSRTSIMNRNQRRHAKQTSAEGNGK